MKTDLNKKYFLEEISKIKEPVIFLGIGQLLGVKLIREDNEVKDFTDLLEEILVAFDQLSRKRKREFIKILRNANLCGDVCDGDNSKD